MLEHVYSAMAVTELLVPIDKIIARRPFSTKANQHRFAPSLMSSNRTNASKNSANSAEAMTSGASSLESLPPALPQRAHKLAPKHAQLNCGSSRPVSQQSSTPRPSSTPASAAASPLHPVRDYATAKPRWWSSASSPPGPRPSFSSS